MLNKALVEILKNIGVDVEYANEIRFFHKDNSYNKIMLDRRFGFSIYLKSTKFEHIIIEDAGDSCSITVVNKHDYSTVTRIDFDDIDYMMLGIMDGSDRIDKIQNDILDNYFSGDKAQYKDFFIETAWGDSTDKDDFIEILYNEYKKLSK